MQQADTVRTGLQHGPATPPDSPLLPRSRRRHRASKCGRARCPAGLRSRRSRPGSARPSPRSCGTRGDMAAAATSRSTWSSSQLRSAWWSRSATRARHRPPGRGAVGQIPVADGHGLGIAGARRLMDSFDIRTTPQGTDVTMDKFLPARSAGPDAAIASRNWRGPWRTASRAASTEEVQLQNQAAAARARRAAAETAGARAAEPRARRHQSRRASRSTPSSTRRRITCAAPTSSSPVSSRT